jgi:MFS family permease
MKLRLTDLQAGLPGGAPGILSLPMIAFYALGFLSHMGMGIVGPNLPGIRDAFGITASQVGLFMASFGMARLLLDLPMGVMLERINRSVLMMAGLLIMATGAFINASTPTDAFPILILGRAIMGAGSCMLNMTVLVSLNQVATREIRGRVMGIQQTCELTGSLIAPVVGGFLGAIYGWRAPFLFCAATAIFSASFVFITRNVRAQPNAATGGHHRQREGSAHPELYAWWRIVAIDFITLTLFFSAAGFLNTAIPMFGGVQLGLGPEMIGVALAVGTVIRLFTSLGGAAVSDRYGRRFVLIPALLILAGGTMGFNLVEGLDPAWHYGAFIVAVAFTGLGRLGNSVPVILLADILPMNKVARFISLNRFVGDMGFILGPLLVGWLIDVSGFGAATSAVAALLFCSAIVALTLVREPSRSRPMAA